MRIIACTLAMATMLLFRPVAAQGGGKTVHEVEPNNTAQSATPAALHDTVVGVFHESGDVDVFSVNLPANTELHLTQMIEATTLVFSVLNPDGATVAGVGMSRTRYKVGAAGTYFISISPAASGCVDCAYHAEIGVYDPPSGPGDPTTVFANSDWAPTRGIAAGPDGSIYLADGRHNSLARVDQRGNVTHLGSGLSGAGEPAVMNNGDILVPVLDDQSGAWGIKRVTPSGSVSRFYTSSGGGPEAEFKPAGVTIGPDGDVWIANLSGTTWHFGTNGTVKEKIPLPAVYVAFSPTGVLHSASWDGKVRRYVNGHAEVVFSMSGSDVMLYDLAFDRDGYLYVGTGRGSKNQWINEIILLDPQYHVVAQPFASSNMDGASFMGLAFARDGSGAMTRRLLIANSEYVIATGDPRHDAILEVKQAAVRAVGWQIGAASTGGGGGGSSDSITVGTVVASGAVGDAYSDTLRAQGAPGAVTWTLTAGALPPGLLLSGATGVIAGTPTDTGTFAFTVKATSGSSSGTGHLKIVIAPVRVTAEQVAAALLGGDALSVAAAQYLDRHGNNNGRLDIGDLRAFLSARGALSPIRAGRRP